MPFREKLRPKSIALDAVLVGSIVVGANLLFDRAHPGWTNLNPSPYLLLPILLGGRYGFTSGVLAGLGASAVIVLQQLLFTPAGTLASPRDLLTASPYLHTSLFFAGALCGELFAWFRRERAQSEAQLDKLNTSVRRLDADVRYLRGVKDELDRVVAARDGEVSALDTELRRLYASNEEDLPGEVLQFLKRQVRLADAAIYFPNGPGRPLTRRALLGNAEHLPEFLDSATSAVARLALSRASLVTLPEILHDKAPPIQERVILAAPLCDSEDHVLALLVVTGLPFINFNAQTANLVTLICNWAGEVLDLALSAEGRYRLVTGRSGVQRVFTRTHFHHLLGLSLEAAQRHQLPAAVILFSLRGASASERSRFETALLGAVRSGDYAAELGYPFPHLAILLPLVGERGATIFIERSKQFLRQTGPWPVEMDIRRLEITRAESPAALLAELDAPSPASPAVQP